MRSSWKGIWRFESAMASIGAGTCLLLIMMITILSVFGRYVLHIDLVPGGYNIIERILFPLLVLWALPIAHREGTFPRLEFIQDSLPVRVRLLVRGFLLIVEIIVYGVVFWFVLQFVWMSVASNRTMQIGSSFIPVWPILVMMPITFGLLLLEMCRLFFCDVRAILFQGSADKPHWVE